jgi:hypothetical protein
MQGRKGKNEKQNKKKKKNSHRGNIHMTGSASAYEGKRKRSEKEMLNIKTARRDGEERRRQKR